MEEAIEKELASPTGQPVDPMLLEEIARMRSLEFNPDQPRDEHGQWTNGGDTRSEKSQRAYENAKPFSREKDAWATRSENEIVGMVGGVKTDDNSPVDVIVKSGKRTYGIEVKTLLDNTNDKVTVRGDALERKIAWARSNHASLHTIIVDDRQKFGRVEGSGHRIYYRRGVGSFRLSSLRKVESSEHLRRLMRIKS